MSAGTTVLLLSDEDERVRADGRLALVQRSPASKTLRFVEVAERIQPSEDAPRRQRRRLLEHARPCRGPDSAEPSNNIIASPFDAEP